MSLSSSSPPLAYNVIGSAPLHSGCRCSRNEHFCWIEEEDGTKDWTQIVGLFLSTSWRNSWKTLIVWQPIIKINIAKQIENEECFLIFCRRLGDAEECELLIVNYCARFLVVSRYCCSISIGSVSPLLLHGVGDCDVLKNEEKGGEKIVMCKRR